MNQIVSSQVRLFLTSIEIGILLGVFFDLIRVIRKIVKHPNIFVQIEDMLYWVISGFVGFYMLYICNYADVRPFIFIGILLGAVFYFCTFSIIFMKIATVIIDYVKALMKKLFKLICIPIIGMIKLIKIPLHYIKGQIAKVLYKHRLFLRTVKRKQYFKKADKRVERYIKKGKI